MDGQRAQLDAAGKRSEDLRAQTTLLLQICTAVSLLLGALLAWLLANSITRPLRHAETIADEDNGPRIIKDANGTPLADGDSVLLVKDLKVKGSSTVIKKGTKIKGIRLVYDNGDHDVDCKTDQGPFILKSEFLKKA